MNQYKQELLRLGPQAVKDMGLWETSFGAVTASHIFDRAADVKAKKKADRQEHVHELMDDRQDFAEGNHIPVEHEEVWLFYFFSLMYLQRKKKKKKK